MPKKLTGLEQAFKAAGSKSELARRLKISHQAVMQWTRVPAEHCRAIEEITGVARAVLRPDIYA